MKHFEEGQLVWLLPMKTTRWETGLYVNADSGNDLKHWVHLPSGVVWGFYDNEIFSEEQHALRVLAL